MVAYERNMETMFDGHPWETVIPLVQYTNNRHLMLSIHDDKVIYPPASRTVSNVQIIVS